MSRLEIELIGTLANTFHDLERASETVRHLLGFSLLKLMVLAERPPTVKVASRRCLLA